MTVDLSVFGAGGPIDSAGVRGLPVAGEAVVESRVLTPGGPRPLPADAVVRVAGGHTRDVDVGSLPPGAYAVQVRGDVPVVAAVMVERRRVAGAPSDLAWSVATPPIRTLAGMALTVRSDGRVGTKEVAIGADSVAALALAGVTSVWVTPLAGQVRAAVLTSAGDAGGELLSLKPLANLTLTTTPAPLRDLSTGRTTSPP